MAKLFFRYSSMGAGKSLDLLKTAYNYEELHKKILIFTSSKDNRFGENKVKSRTGLEKPAIGVDDEFNIFEYVKNYFYADCVLVDEVQFFKKHHIYQLTDIVDKLNIPVIAYGLRSDFKTEPFEGSTYMLILADQIEELKTLCHECDKKATLNVRYTTKEGTMGLCKSILTEGEQVQVGGNESYMPLCRKCYKELLENTKKIKEKDISIIPEGLYCYKGLKFERGVYHIKRCPYWDKTIEGGEQNDGYCHYLEAGDNEGGFDLLWDQCKSCGINDPDENYK
jgi:thymidine kinase